mmetsp:Transcript_29963/g.82228  ORF Transcript_29963/g.82228 Transcript_29963/m.82228 type:complete len:227 (+) Transcript_29963:1010-1690(+)
MPAMKLSNCATFGRTKGSAKEMQSTCWMSAPRLAKDWVQQCQHPRLTTVLDHHLPQPRQSIQQRANLSTFVATKSRRNATTTSIVESGQHVATVRGTESSCWESALSRATLEHSEAYILPGAEALLPVQPKKTSARLSFCRAHAASSNPRNKCRKEACHSFDCATTQDQVCLYAWCVGHNVVTYFKRWRCWSQLLYFLAMIRIAQKESPFIRRNVTSPFSLRITAP